MIRRGLPLTCAGLGVTAYVFLAQVEPARGLNQTPEFWKKEGAVRSADVAIGIGEAIGRDYYGDEQIDEQLPLKAKLRKGVWQVRGTLPEGMLGGIVEVDVQKSDGKVVRLTHSK